MITVSKQEIADFLDGYSECAGWTDSHNWDRDTTLPNTNEASWMLQVHEITSWVLANWDDCLAYAKAMSWGALGHDLWLTRNGHGAGFWDRGLGDLGKNLTDSAHALGAVYLLIGDDGRLHYCKG